jgi:alcohol dehydrogenase
LSAHCDLIHGIAVGVLLPHVIRYNGSVPEIAQLYGKLAEDAGICKQSDAKATDRLADFITDLVRQAQQPTSLSECEVDESLFEIMASEADQQWTGKNNPRPVSIESLLELYRCAY